MTSAEQAMFRTCQFNWGIESGKYDAVLLDILDALTKSTMHLRPQGPAIMRVEFIKDTVTKRLDQMTGFDKLISA